MGNRARLLTVTLVLGLLSSGGTSGASAKTDAEHPLRSISIGASKPVILVGQQTRIGGAVTPRKIGVRLALQQKVTGGWKNLARASTNVRGKYRFTVQPPKGGVFRYRVIKLPWRTDSARSATVRLTVYEWHRIDGLVVDTDYADFDTDSEIAGTTYPNSVELDADTGSDDPPDEPGFFVVDANKQCAVLDTTVGALDGNTEGTEVDVRVSGDGAALATGTYALGESDRLTLDIRGVSLLRVETFDVEEGVDRALGVGTPRVLCTF
jgi:hypothetical protein